MESSIFATWVVVFVSGISSLVLFDLYFRFKKDIFKTNKDKQLRGVLKILLLFSISLLSWSFLGICTILFDHAGLQYLLIHLKVFFSTLNTYCLLFSICYFEKTPRIILDNNNFYRKLILGSTLFEILISYLIIEYSTNLNIILLPDLILSTITIFLFAYVIFLTFWIKKIRIIAFISCLTF